MTDPATDLTAALDNAAALLDDLDPETDLGKRLIHVGRELGNYAYWISVGKVADAAQSHHYGTAAQAHIVTENAEMAPDRLGLDLIFRASEAFAAWSEGKWDPPVCPFQPDAARSARDTAGLAFVRDVMTELDARLTDPKRKTARHRA